MAMGWTILRELLLGHNPGDAKDKPSAEELKGLAGGGKSLRFF